MCAKFLSTTHFLFRNYDLRGFIQKQEHIQPIKLYRKLKRKSLLLAPSCICVLKFVTLCDENKQNETLPRGKSCQMLVGFHYLPPASSSNIFGIL